MKKIIYNFSLILLFVVSCSKPDDSKSTNANSSTNLILPKNIIITYSNGTFAETNSTYNGNKIVESLTTNSSNNSVEKTTYTYTGDFITRKTGNFYYKDYTYENGKIKNIVTYLQTPSNGQLVIIGKSRVTYTYNANGTISRQSYNIDIYNGQEFLDNNGTSTLTVLNNKIIKHVVTGSTNSSTSITTVTYEYDAKNNPFKNVLGLDVMLFDNPQLSPVPINNLTKDYRVNVETFNSGVINTYIVTKTHQYVYDNQDFVKEDKEYLDANANSPGVGLRSTTTYSY
jgi:hypothetical protein